MNRRLRHQKKMKLCDAILSQSWISNLYDWHLVNCHQIIDEVSPLLLLWIWHGIDYHLPIKQCKMMSLFDKTLASKNTNVRMHVKYVISSTHEAPKPEILLNVEYLHAYIICDFAGKPHLDPPKCKSPIN